MMQDIISWDQEEIPIEWKDVYLVKLPRRSYLQECENCIVDNAPVSEDP